MKTCPGCSFLMDDDESMCGPCQASSERVGTFSGEPPPRPAGGRVGTAVLERPISTGPFEKSVRFRDPGRSRRTARSVTVLIVLCGGVAVLGVMGVRGQGPLAPTAVSMGLADPPSVVVPGQWESVTSGPGAFRAEVPRGGVEHLDAVDPLDPQRGAWVGHRIQLGEAAEMIVVSTDLGVPGGVRGVDSAGLAQLVDGIVATGRFGIEITRRETLLGTGPVVDSVALGNGTTARVRFALAGGRLHLLLTQGSDEGSRSLDRAHGRLLAGFQPQS
jgi:hypothetical protein